MAQTRNHLGSGSGAGTTFAPDDCPIDTGDIEVAKVFQQRLNGEETNCGRRGTQMLNAWQAVLFVFDADAPPDMPLLRGELETTGEHLR